jgi:hypothetical protein
MKALLVSTTLAVAGTGLLIAAKTTTPNKAMSLQDANIRTVMKSINSGKRWTLANKGLPNDADVLALVSNPASPSTLYAGTQAGMFKSIDAGESWRSVGPKNVSINAFAIDPQVPSTAYASGGAPFRGYSLFKSLDDGESWNQVAIRTDGFAEPHIFSLAVDPTNSAILYVAGKRLIKSSNAGRDWIEIDDGLPINAAVDIYALAIDPISPSTIYVALNGIFTRPGVYRSTDRGLTWEGRYDGLLYGATEPATLVIDPLTPSTLYCSVGFSLFRSTNNGGTWSETSLRGRILSTAVAPGVLYAGSQQALSKSDDGGLNSRSVVGGSILSIAIDPRTTSTVYIGRVAAAPKILSVSTVGKNLIVEGEFFDIGAVILIDGIQQRTVADAVNPTTTLVARRAAVQIAPGQRVTIHVRNPDGTVSNAFTFIRSS